MSNFVDYGRISVVHAELEGEGFDVPTYATVRRWVQERKVRALRTGSGQLLVNRADMLKMVTPVPVVIL